MTSVAPLMNSAMSKICSPDANSNSPLHGVFPTPGGVSQNPSFRELSPAPWASSRPGCALQNSRNSGSFALLRPCAADGAAVQPPPVPGKNGTHRKGACRLAIRRRT